MSQADFGLIDLLVNSCTPSADELILEKHIMNENKPGIGDSFFSHNKNSSANINAMPSASNQEAEPANIDDAILKIAGAVNVIVNVFTGKLGLLLIISTGLLVLFLPDLLLHCKTLSLVQAKSLLETIDNALLNDAMNRAEVALKSYHEKYNTIANQFKNWTSGATEAIRNAAKTQLQHSYLDINLNGIANIKKDFLHPTYGGFLLHHFIGASARHVAAIKDFHIHAIELNLAVIPPATRGAKQLLLDELRADIQNISDAAIKMYHHCEQAIINSTEGYKRSWDHLNNYRKHVIVTALDALPAFQYLDPELYPNGCNTRYRNRKVITFLDTSHLNPSTLSKEKILAMEAIFEQVKPVRVLKELTMHRAASRSTFSRYYDGLCQVACLVKTTDGFEYEYPEPASGAVRFSEDGSDGVESLGYLKPYLFKDPCFKVDGVYMPDRETHYGTKLHTCLTKLNVHMFDPDHMPYQCLFYFESIFYKAQRANFSMTVPAGGDQIKGTDVSGRLAEIKIDQTQNNGDAYYTFYWHDKTMLEPMLPKRSHQVDFSSIAVEQFHAIRAGKSITQQKLPCIRGPGFTGGDLVELPRMVGVANSSLDWFVEHTGKVWFAGKYKIRIWYFNQSDKDVKIPFFLFAFSPANGFFSAINDQISPTGGDANPADLHFEDLQSYTPSDEEKIVLITDTMASIEIKFVNRSPSVNIIIDRIELIFFESAS
jgi:hypothetical protein